ncbi:hypothetical protein BG003_004052 [Podila horticola]|nr:hypothetical protein BG003_004052 [Podila horticola]
MVNENTPQPLAVAPATPSSTLQQLSASLLQTLPKRKIMSSAPSNPRPAKSGKHAYTARDTEWLVKQLQDPEIYLPLQSGKDSSIHGITKTRIHELIAENMSRTFPGTQVTWRQIKNKISRMKAQFRAADTKKQEPKFASLDEEHQKTFIEDVCPFYFTLLDTWGKCWAYVPRKTEDEIQEAEDAEDCRADVRDNDEDEKEDEKEEVLERRSRSHASRNRSAIQPIPPQPRPQEQQEHRDNAIIGEYSQPQFRGQTPTTGPIPGTLPARTLNKPKHYQMRRDEQRLEQSPPIAPEPPENVIPKMVMDQINYLFVESNEARKTDSAYESKRLEARKMESAYELRKLEASILEKQYDHERRMMMDKFEHEKKMAQIHAETRDHERRRALIEAEQRDQDRSLRRRELDVLAREQTLQLGFMRQQYEK